jgi:zinc/manganese transport system substrate-binding protein/manganese/iron transport system substrate-binding protein
LRKCFSISGRPGIADPPAREEHEFVARAEFGLIQLPRPLLLRNMYQLFLRALLLSLVVAAFTAHAAPLRVVATTSLIADVARAVGGPDVEVESLIPSNVDPHAFDPSPRDMARLQEADLILANGLGLETFLEKILAAGGARHGDRLVVVSEGRSPRGCASDHEHGEEHHDHDHGEVDPHVWFDPTWVQLWSDNIAEAFAARDPANAEAYRARAAAYRDQLAALDNDLRAAFDAIPPERRQLVTDHHELGYLSDRYGLRIIGAILPNVTTVAEISARDFAELQRKMQETGARVIVVGHAVSPSLAERLARDVGARVIRVRTHGLGEPDAADGTYLGFMRQLAEQLSEALRADAL